MFKTLISASAALLLMTGAATQAQARVLCGETSTVFETENSSMQIHRDGSVTFWARNSSGSIYETGEGSWLSSSNGDIRVTANGRSHVFRGFLNKSCNRLF